jgi:hypothetical protein
MATLYAAGFVGNFIVPRPIDSAPQIPQFHALLLNLCLLALFALQQKWAASGGIGRLCAASGAGERYTCVLFSSLTLMVLLWLWQPVNTLVWNISHPAWRAAIHTAFTAGWLLLILNYWRRPGLACHAGWMLALGAAVTMTVGHLLFAIGMYSVAYWTYRHHGGLGLTFHKASRLR